MQVIEPKSTNKFSYGLFLLTAKTSKHNGCIINTAIQVTSEPLKISIAVNKNNYTLSQILQTKEFNISILSEKCPFDIFKRFGFQSGKDVDKFENFPSPTSSNGLKYLKEDYANAYMSLEVESTHDLGTHILIVAKVTEAKILSDAKSATYAYYFENIKPKKPTQQNTSYNVYTCQLCGYNYDEATNSTPFNSLEDGWICPICGMDKSQFKLTSQAKQQPAKSKIWVCSICGYTYDDAKEKIPFEELPNDWVCPLCKHPKSDFELLK